MSISFFRVKCFFQEKLWKTLGWCRAAASAQDMVFESVVLANSNCNRCLGNSECEIPAHHFPLFRKHLLRRCMGIRLCNSLPTAITVERISSPVWTSEARTGHRLLVRIGQLVSLEQSNGINWGRIGRGSRRRG